MKPAPATHSATARTIAVTAAAGCALTSAPAPVTPLAAVQFVSPEVGFVVGAGRILSTSDGGSTWQVSYHGPAQLDVVDFVDAAHGWAVGPDSVLATDDAGATWQQLPEPCPELDSVHFVSPDTGFAVAGGTEAAERSGQVTPVLGGRLLATHDGGRTWAAIAGAPANAESACFTTASDGWLGTPEAIWRTTDAGATWSRAFSEPATAFPEPPAERDLAVLQCGDSALWALFLGYGAGLGNAPYLAYASEDGLHWRAVMEETYMEQAARPELHAPEGPGSYPGPFSAVDERTAVFIGWDWAVGLGAAPVQLATEGGARLLSEPDVGGLTSPTSAAYMSAGEGWVVGEDEVSPTSAYDVIERTTDGGATWIRQLTLPAAG